MTQPPQTIVALVDGSIYSASLCEHAAWAARRTGHPVQIIHVLGRRDASDRHDHSGAISLGARSALLQELAELDAQRAKLISRRGRAILEDASAILEGAGVADVTARLRHGDLVETVTELQAETGMIMIGKRGEAADFARGHLGSNLERIVRATHRPIFVASRAFRPISRVLVAYDGGASAAKAVDFIAASPLFQGLEVSVAKVGTKATAVETGQAQAKAKLSAAGLATETAILPGQPETALSQYIEEAGFDLLVMGAYGHSRIRSLMIGSTTTEMIRSCKVPIVLVR